MTTSPTRRRAGGLARGLDSVDQECEPEGPSSRHARHAREGIRLLRAARRAQDGAVPAAGSSPLITSSTCAVFAPSERIRCGTCALK